jgi:SAM-dependent methyltransferase
MNVPQNIYDDARFHAAYSELPRSILGLDAAPEWATLRGLLPPIDGRHVVDLGCGFGWFCRWAAEQGARSVTGIDWSERMLARARADTVAASISYERQDLDVVELPVGRYDLAYSSLTLHYLTDLDHLMSTVARALEPGGMFVFSVEHPIFTAPSLPAFVTDEHGHSTWPLDGYLDEGERTTDWLAPGVIKRHRTIGTYVDHLLRAGYALRALVEWGPDDTQIAKVPEWAVERERPPFLLMSAQLT